MTARPGTARPGVARPAPARLPVWDRALLFHPDVSIRLGAAHLADLLQGHAHVARALAAHGAGSAPAARWAAKPGAAHPEAFAERIPYVDIRGDVRVVQRNRAFHEALGVRDPLHALAVLAEARLVGTREHRRLAALDRAAGALPCASVGPRDDR